MIAAPMFHSWGFAHFTLALPLVLDARAAPTLRPRGHAARRRRAPRQRARGRAGDAAAHARAAGRDDRSATTLHAPEDHRPSGSALPGELAIRAMDTFGEVLYNLYGSTEVAWATIATPAGSARRARDRRAPAARDRRQAARRAGPRGAQGADRAHLRRQRDGLRRLHRRRRQGDRRRADEHRRRRALRRSADGCSWTAATTR